ncbi:MAG: transglutaminase family protein [Solirubrobacteraceae bacterium]|nr:transglutaminase family protein [Solirubrobacteraceae bacterium]
MQQGAFVKLMGNGEPGLEPLLLSLAAEIGHVAGQGAAQALRTDQAHGQLEHLAASLAGVDSLPPTMQLQLLSSLVLGRFSIDVEPHRVDFGDLRPDVVLGERSGHPIVVAAVVAAVAQRAGLPVAVVVGDANVLLAHRTQDPPLAISVDRHGEVLDARELRDGNLSWRCAHEISAAILDLVLARSETLGLRPVTVRACELATALPLDPHALAHRDAELSRALSAWN